MVGDGEGGGGGEPAVEECHFWLGADEHVGEGAVLRWFEEDIASVVG